MKNKTPDLIDLHVPFFVEDSQAIVGVKSGWMVCQFYTKIFKYYTFISFQGRFPRKKTTPPKGTSPRNIALPHKGRVRVSFWDGKNVKSVGRAVQLPWV